MTFSGVIFFSEQDWVVGKVGIFTWLLLREILVPNDMQNYIENNIEIIEHWYGILITWLGCAQESFTAFTIFVKSTKLDLIIIF